MRQIEYPLFNIYYKIQERVVFTIVVDKKYPIKLAAAFINALVGPFFDKARCMLGADNFATRLESIEGSHYFIKFDQVIKQKKKEYEDPSTSRNTEKMKK